MMKRIFLFLLLLSFTFLVCLQASEEITSSSRQEMLETMDQKLAVLVEQALRDKEKATELRDKALTQIRNAEEILKEAEEAPGEPELDEVRLHHAPQALAQGKEVLVKAEKAIKEAERRFQWARRARIYLRTEKDWRGPQAAHASMGYTIPFFSKGEVEIVYSGKDKAVPFHAPDEQVLFTGDEIITGKDGRVGVASLYSRAHIITIGPQTDIKLAQDSNQGSVWNLYVGVIHCAPAEAVKDETNPRIETPDTTIECTEGSEFDVFVDAHGRTHVEIYRGEVKQSARKFDPEVQHILEGLKEQNPPPAQWWEESGP